MQGLNTVGFVNFGGTQFVLRPVFDCSEVTTKSDYGGSLSVTVIEVACERHWSPQGLNFFIQLLSRFFELASYCVGQYSSLP